MSTLVKDNLTGENHEGNHANTPLRYLTATSIMGDSVFNHEGDKLGGIKEIMIDIKDGKIEYLVVEFGGFLGIGEKYFAIPFGLFQVDTEKEALLLYQRKEILQGAPGFDKDHWPETNSHAFQESHAYWGGFMGGNTGGPY